LSPAACRHPPPLWLSCLRCFAVLSGVNKPHSLSLGNHRPIPPTSTFLQQSGISEAGHRESCRYVDRSLASPTDFYSRTAAPFRPHAGHGYSASCSLPLSRDPVAGLCCPPLCLPLHSSGCIPPFEDLALVLTGTLSFPFASLYTLGPNRFSPNRRFPASNHIPSTAEPTHTTSYFPATDRASNSR
jgi:hypothetical protein